jgi:hypothetical protein
MHYTHRNGAQGHRGMLMVDEALGDAGSEERARPCVGGKSFG